MDDSQVAAFAAQIAQTTRSHLGERMAGAYLFGSAATGDWRPASSDIDVAAVCSEAPAPAALRTLAAAVLDVAVTAPARGLEFVLYDAAQARHPDGSVTLNVNGGPAMAAQVDVDVADFWFALDAAILRETAVTLVGPPASAVFGTVADGVLRPALEQSLRWHAQHAAARPHAAVLAACRSWRYLEEGVWSTKSAAAHWAAKRCPRARPLFSAALAARDGPAPPLPTQAAVDLVEQVCATYL